MEIGIHRVATINYTLKDKDGNLIDGSSNGGFRYLHGAGNIIPGLEKALEGKRKGELFQIVIRPEDGYGVRNSRNIHKIPLDRLPQGQAIKPGMSYQATADNGKGIVVTITRVDDEGAVIDANHPLAGVSLYFDIEVLDVREADAEEIRHGHAHDTEGRACA